MDCRKEQLLYFLLLRCVEDGHEKGAEAALAAGASVDGPLMSKDGCPLARAVLFGQASMVDLLIKKGANVGAGFPEDVRADGVVAIAKGSQPLHIAASCCQSNIIGLLLESGAMVNATDAYGSTPLLASCLFRLGDARSSSTITRAHVGRELLGAGADATLADITGRIALHYAADIDDTDVIELLVSAAPETLNRVDWAGETPLFAAAQAGNVNSIRCLLLAGASQPAPTHETIKCPLVVAVEKGHGIVVHVLLDEGMEALYGPVMHDAIVEAVAQRRAGILHALLEWGEDNLGPWEGLNGLRLMGTLILHFAASHSDPATIGVLLALGADENEADNCGQRPGDVIGVREGCSQEKQEACVRVLERGPAYRALSWTWPVRHGARAETRARKPTLALGIFIAAHQAAMRSATFAKLIDCYTQKP